MESVYIVWEYVHDHGDEMRGIFATMTEAIEFSRPYHRIERYDLPFTEDSVIVQVYPEDES